MERDNQNYNRDYRNENYRSNDRNRGQRDEQFENYRDRYSSHGNYYGLRSDDAAYRNVSSYNSNNMGNYSGQGRDDRHDSGSRQGSQNDRGSSQNYHYGDPNPYMQNDRNGGYDRTRGTGWRDNNDRYSHYGSNRTNDRDSYDRQDNSYHYGDQGQGRRYNDFGRDEGRTYNRNTNRGYNMETEDSQYGRSEINRSRSDNDYRGSNPRSERNYNQWQDRNEDKEDFRYGGRIQSQDGSEQSSSRRGRSGHSGPDYSAHSAISSYGEGEYRG